MHDASVQTPSSYSCYLKFTYTNTNTNTDANTNTNAYTKTTPKMCTGAYDNACVYAPILLLLAILP